MVRLPPSRQRRRPRALVGLSLAAVVATSAAPAGHAAEDIDILNTYRVENVGGTGHLRKNTNTRDLAITSLFQPPDESPTLGTRTGRAATVDDDYVDVEDENFGAYRTMTLSDYSSIGGPSQYIVNGVDVPPNRFPWFVAAMNSEIKFGGCAGSLIAQDWILTAGHCVTNGYNGATPPDVHHYEVGYMGALCVNDVNNCGQAYMDVKPAYARVHPDYDWWTNRIFPDLALVRLESPVTNIEPVDIDTGTYVRFRGDEENLRGQIFTVIGAGWTVGMNRDSFPQYLQQVDVPYVGKAQCASAYNDSPSSDHWQTELCAGAQSRDSCNGDSGGPLVIKEGFGANARYVLIGSVSYGTPDCDGTPPGVYASVGSEIDWIMSEVCDGIRDPSWCPGANTQEDIRTSALTREEQLCQDESFVKYRHRRRRDNKPAIFKNCEWLGSRGPRSRQRICKRIRTARRKCSNTCSEKCTDFFANKRKNA